MRPALMRIFLSAALAAGLSPRVACPARDPIRPQPLVLAQNQGAVAVPGSADAPAADANDEYDDGGAAGAANAQMPGNTEFTPQPSAPDPEENPAAQQPPSSDDEAADNPAVQQPAGDNGGELSGEQNPPADDDQ